MTGTKNRWAFVKPFLVVTAEVSSLFTILGFVISVFFNALMFLAWGLDYTQIASPSDVIMGGFSWAVIFASISALILIISVALNFLCRPFSRNMSESAINFTGIVLLSITVIVLIAFHVIDITRERVNIVFIIMILNIACWVAILSHGLSKIKPIRFTSYVAIFFLVVQTLMFFIHNVTLSTQSLMSINMDEYHQERFCSEPEALWIGSESVVGRCSIDDRINLSIRREYFVIPRSDVTLTRNEIEQIGLGEQ